jgi:hypothetical protein
MITGRLKKSAETCATVLLWVEWRLAKARISVFGIGHRFEETGNERAIEAATKTLMPVGMRFTASPRRDLH